MSKVKTQTPVPPGQPKPPDDPKGRTPQGQVTWLRQGVVRK